MIFITLNGIHKTRVRVDHIVSYESVASGERVTVRDTAGVLHYSDETVEEFEKRLGEGLSEFFNTAAAQ